MRSCPCDGCDLPYEMGELSLVLDLGHECRYCDNCHVEYEAWISGVKAMEAKLQAELDVWQREMRGRIPLKRVPTDFPIVRRVPDGRPLVLG